jgi:hypothetical protein
VIGRVIDRITEFARSRSEDEWREYIRERFEFVRNLVRENGEKAAILGFVLGIGLVIFFKLFVLLLVVAVGVYSTILILADGR